MNLVHNTVICKRKTLTETKLCKSEFPFVVSSFYDYV